MPVDAESRPSRCRYSICTLVTDRAEYDAMVESFRGRGFVEPDCEFLFVDNSAANRRDAFSGLNLMLARAHGEYVVFCHQDVRLLEDGRRRLDELVAAADPTWAVLANAGGVAPGRLAIRISDPHGRDTRTGDLPARVASVDENFFVVRRAANLGFSRDLKGFHLYATDLCLVADLLGWSAWVVDFHLEHKSAGSVGDEFRGAQAALVAKYERAYRPRWIQTTCTLFFLSASRFRNRLFSRGFFRRRASADGAGRDGRYR